MTPCLLLPRVPWRTNLIMKRIVVDLRGLKERPHARYTDCYKLRLQPTFATTAHSISPIYCPISLISVKIYETISPNNPRISASNQRDPITQVRWMWCWLISGRSWVRNLAGAQDCIDCFHGFVPLTLSCRTTYTGWFKYDRDCLHLFTHKSVPVIFEPPCIYVVLHR